MNTWFSNLEIIQIDGLLYMQYCNLAYDDYIILKSWNYTNWRIIVYVILELSIWWIHDSQILKLYKLMVYYICNIVT